MGHVFLRKVLKLYKSETNFFISFCSFIWNKYVFGLDLLVHHKLALKGRRGIVTKDTIEVGLGDIGFSYKNDITLINNRGKLVFIGKYSIGRGCRIDIGPNGIVEFGNGGYVNCNTLIIVMNSLKIGDDTVISWNCQFLDDDFHKVVGQKANTNARGISIGNHVWIGCNVKIYKGVSIPDGCIIASDSVVKKSFNKKNALIAGNPAVVIKNNVVWEK